MYKPICDSTANFVSFLTVDHSLLFGDGGRGKGNLLYYYLIYDQYI